MARANTSVRQLEAYEKLYQYTERFREIPILPYRVEAVSQLERLRQARIRIGTMDLKIAATCLAHGATLLTRNLKDFGKVLGLRAEDWSV